MLSEKFLRGLLANRYADEQKKEIVQQLISLRETAQELAKQGDEVFKSHCLNSGHGENRMCPVCVDFCAALAKARDAGLL